MITKDADFAALVQQVGSPPAVLWLRCGKKTSAETSAILIRSIAKAVALVSGGEPIVEIID